MNFLLGVLFLPMQKQAGQESIGHIAGSRAEKILTIRTLPGILTRDVSGSSEPTTFAIQNFVTPRDHKACGQTFGVHVLDSFWGSRPRQTFEAHSLNLHRHCIQMRQLLSTELGFMVSIWKNQLLPQGIFCLNVMVDVVTCQTKFKLFQMVKLRFSKGRVVLRLFK